MVTYDSKLLVIKIASKTTLALHSWQRRIVELATKIRYIQKNNVHYILTDYFEHLNRFTHFYRYSV